MTDSFIPQQISNSLPFTPQIVIAPTMAHDIDELTKSVFSDGKLAIVCDSRTQTALGDQVLKALKNGFTCTPILLKGWPEADEAHIDQIRRSSKNCDGFIAVGSGTINDLVKYASFLENKPYIVFPTAASMNGYLSANASITYANHKKTVAAHMPKAVFCDMSVIAAAPQRLAKSGLGDSLARPTAQADWLLSHIVLNTDYDERPFTLLASREPYLFENARGIALRDPHSLTLLMEILLLSGIGMTLAGGSYPASQGEHMIAHAYHMLRRELAAKTFHGEEIGVTTLGMARRQEILLQEKPIFAPGNFDLLHMQKVFSPSIVKEAAKGFVQKQELIEKNYDSLKNWDDIAHKILPVCLSSDKIQAILDAANAPSTPGDIGWDIPLYIEASRSARYLRDRFTFLDLNPG